MANETCFCGEELSPNGECWQGSVMGGHQGNCAICGENALLDGLRCCSADCDIALEEKCPGCSDGPEETTEMNTDGLDALWLDALREYARLREEIGRKEEIDECACDPNEFHACGLHREVSVLDQRAKSLMTLWGDTWAMKLWQGGPDA